MHFLNYCTTVNFQDVPMLCPDCKMQGNYKLKTASGNPCNLLYILHWDSWRAFKERNRSCGALDLTVANMSKEERTKSAHVFLAAFVPIDKFHEISDGNHSRPPFWLHPFLQKLLDEIAQGYIEGNTLIHGILDIVSEHLNSFSCI